MNPVSLASAVVVTSPVVAILTVLTRQKSHHSTANFEAKEIGCYRQRGGVRGCDPADECMGLPVLRAARVFPQEINAMELSTNPVPALSGPVLLTSSLYRSIGPKQPADKPIALS